MLVVATTTLRKFVLGGLKGSGKEATVLASYKRWGVEFPTNDECDAHALAQLGRVRLHMDAGMPVGSVTKPMLEAAAKATALTKPVLEP